MKSDQLIYLDNNATTRTDPAVVEAMLPYWSELYLNPSSLAGDMFGAAQPIQEAKVAIAQLIRAEPSEIFLTSGATESNNWVLQSTIQRIIRQKGSCRILVSAIEHPSVLDTLEALKLADKKIHIELIPVLSNGQICLNALVNLLKKETDFVSIMFANNESGVIQPLIEAALQIKTIHPDCIIHTDATQATGKIPVDLNHELQDIDLLSLSAHKFHGPKGIGALFIRSGIHLEPLIYGGNQQAGMRAGTENPALAAGLAQAAKLAKLHIQDMSSIQKLRDTMETKIANQVPNVTILGSDSPRLPNTALLLFRHTEGDMIVHNLLENGIACSTGAACSRGTDVPSHVVTAMGVDHDHARNVVRFSISKETTLREIDDAVAALIKYN